MNLIPATVLRRNHADPACAFAVQNAPRRDRVVFLVGSTVYLWPVPARPDALRVRRVRLDAPVRRAPDGPVFGGDDEPEPLAPRRVQADRLRRLQARAALYTTPATLCSTQDIADVFALRESEVRASRPANARRIGRAWMAPFGDWLVALGVDLGRLAAQAEAPRVIRTRAPAAPTLRPLGGPSAGRR
jgi:hypothetical protein